MSTLQIRNVPDDVRHTLKARASAAGQSLSEYLLAEVTRVARRPTLAEMHERVARHGPSDLPSAADVLHSERSSRGR